MDTRNLSLSSNPRSTKKPYAIVIGLDGMNGIQTARILANRGVPVIGIVENLKHCCCRTNVCKRILLGGSENEQMISVLEDLGSKLDHKAVLFPVQIRMCYSYHVIVADSSGGIMSFCRLLR
jgi:hypothetical protein